MHDTAIKDFTYATHDMHGTLDIHDSQNLYTIYSEFLQDPFVLRLILMTRMILVVRMILRIYG